VRLIEAGEPVALVYGVNLPALLRAMCYRNLSLSELTAKVVEGGQRGVFVYQTEQGNICPRC
jgi:mannose/fructose-specific phosphotransferase system component IIA